MRAPDIRFFFVEHPVGMIVAIVLAHIGRVKSRRVGDALQRHKAAAMSLRPRAGADPVLDPVAVLAGRAGTLPLVRVALERGEVAGHRRTQALVSAALLATLFAAILSAQTSPLTVRVTADDRPVASARVTAGTADGETGADGRATVRSRTRGGPDRRDGRGVPAGDRDGYTAPARRSNSRSNSSRWRSSKTRWS